MIDKLLEPSSRKWLKTEAGGGVVFDSVGFDHSRFNLAESFDKLQLEDFSNIWTITATALQRLFSNYFLFPVHVPE